MTDNQQPAVPETPTELQGLIRVGERFVELQSKQLDIKKTEIEANKEIALASIKAQTELSSHDRTHEGGQQKAKYLFTTGIVVIALTAVIILVYLGAEALVSDIVKVVLGFAAGAFGGYQLGKNKAITATDDDED